MEGERRERILYVDERDVLPALQARLPLTTIQFGDVPLDCKVKSVHYDWARRSFAFALSHPTFEPVPCGEAAPELISRIIVNKAARDDLGGLVSEQAERIAQLETESVKLADMLRKASDYIQRAKIAARCHAGQDLADAIRNNPDPKFE
ncbi:MAG: hypothetical protein ABFD92_21715 [Planctomycetaceae bacterium]